MELINLFLGHVSDITRDGDVIFYEYVLSWIPLLIQNLGKKDDTALLLVDEQGVTKDFFTDAIYRMFEIYLRANETQFENICGRLDESIEYILLVVFNEFQSMDYKICSKIDERFHQNYFYCEILVIRIKFVKLLKDEIDAS
jgi:hypothetical protein